MPSLSSIHGLGEKAVQGIVDAAKDGPFLSKEDFRNRSKVSKTVCDLMSELHILRRSAGEQPVVPVRFIRRNYDAFYLSSNPSF